MHQTGKVSFVHLDLLIPLKNPSDSNIFGILVLRIDPHKVLYPLLKSWPVVSKTAETLLFHREGDEIVYLNELRHSGNPNLIVRMPVTSEKLAAAMALRGIQETTDAIDYRGDLVIAAMNKVPESPWYLVAKIDLKKCLRTWESGQNGGCICTSPFIKFWFIHGIPLVDSACKVLQEQI